MLWLAAVLLGGWVASACDPAADVVDIWSGAQFVCVGMSGGHLRCFGRNDAGMLGYGDTLQRGSAPSTMGTNLPALPSTLTAMHLGGDFACGNTSAALVCWGSNAQGQLGSGSISNTSLAESVAARPPVSVP
eukprot:Hpha_TRINITY_DN28144_c0_g1::TRINITY_DN28144_c0_g1_i1::g.103210::m.103210